MWSTNGRKKNRSDVTDGGSWKCGICKGRASIRKASFFSRSNLPLQKWMILIWFWSKDAPVTSAATDADVDNHTAIDCYQWLIEVCSTTLINNGPIILGEPGVIVQVDESLFRHKPRYRHCIYINMSQTKHPKTHIIQLW